MKISDIRPEVYDMAAKAQERLAGRFAEIDRIAEINTRRVMEAFQNNRVAQFARLERISRENTGKILDSFRQHRVCEGHFAPSTGYGYDDLGRETLDKIYAEIFGTEAALVRIGFVNGTHALTAAMFALVKPGDTIVAVTGMPYDTLRSAIGISGDCHGSLKFYGINYGYCGILFAAFPNSGIVCALDGLGPEIEGNDGGKHRQKLLPRNTLSQGQGAEHRRHGQRDQTFDAQKFVQSVFHTFPPNFSRSLIL